MVVLDNIDKAAGVRLLQLELNDFYGVVLKFTGTVAEVRTAVDAGERQVRHMGAECIASVIPAPDPGAWPALLSPVEYSPLLEANVVHYPNYESLTQDTNRSSMEPYAIGLLETQGFTAVFEAIDTACKAANVVVLGKEKLGGGYVTVIIKGDVAAVNAAVAAGQAKVQGLGKLIAAHVIARPSEGVLSLLPK